MQNDFRGQVNSESKAGRSFLHRKTESNRLLFACCQSCWSSEFFGKFIRKDQNY